MKHSCTAVHPSSGPTPRSRRLADRYPRRLASLGASASTRSQTSWALENEHTKAESPTGEDRRTEPSVRGDFFGLLLVVAVPVLLDVLLVDAVEFLGGEHREEVPADV